LNGLLVVAVAFLFYKLYATAPRAESAAHASTTHAADTSKAPVVNVLASAKGEGIFFVNTDTLLARYTVFKKQKEALEAKGLRIESEIKRRAAALQQELGQAQQKMQSGQMNESQAQ
jgi:hypothetical protein